MAEARDFPVGDTSAGRAQIATVSEAEPSGVELTSLPRGTAIHRYVLLDEIGSGGMGVVYAAYDYGLDRKVAIKLVRDPGRSAARRRLVREAQALAQLSHPNVVTVFDVGTYRDQVFVAMEFVAGQTLRTWLGSAERGWREVVEVLRRAGEGLAAAHGAGIVHRDFKPDNVLIDGQGRVRVGDFGLAFVDRGEDEEEEQDERSDEMEPGATAALDDPTTSLTVTGMAVGTPAYMAPEQRTSGLPLDGRADQFAFCVALHEALCGERPFGDESGPDLNERVARGAVRDLPRDRAMPAGLRKVIRRGLAFDPADRYPSMEALLADVDRVLGARGRRTVALAAGGAASLIVAATALAGSGLFSPEPARPCRGAAGKLSGVWDAGRKQAVRAAFGAASPNGGARSFARVEPALDRYARGWTAMHTESCEATHVRGEQSDVLLDLRTQCLDRRLAGLRALVDLFLDADAALVKRATQAVLALDPVDACANTTALREVLPPRDAATAARADQLREQVARVRALITTGKYRDAVAQSAPLVAEARALGYRPLEADALYTQGRALRATDQLAEAEDTLYQAITAAESGRSSEVSVDAWLELLWVVGDEQKRIPEARRLAQVARGAIERLGGSPRAEGKLEDWTGMMYFNEARYEEAREPLQRALARFRQHGEDSPEMSSALRHLGDVSVQLGRTDEALDLYRRARAILEKHYGPEHPNAISLVGSEGMTLHFMGRQDEALAIFERGLAAEERGSGPMTHTAGTFHKFIGLARLKKGDLEGARRSLERSVEVLGAVFGPEHGYVGPALSSLGMVLTAMRRRGDALRVLERSVVIQERNMGVDHPDVALALDRIAQLHIESGQPKRAVAPLERGLRIRERHAGAPSDLATTRYQLAQALRRSGGSRARVRKLLRAALVGFEKAGDEATAAQTRKWLRARGLVEPR